MFFFFFPSCPGTSSSLHIIASPALRPKRTPTCLWKRSSGCRSAKSPFVGFVSGLRELIRGCAERPGSSRAREGPKAKDLPGSPSGLSWAPPGGTPPSRRRKPGSAPRESETGSCGRPPPSSAAPAAPWGRGHRGPPGGQQAGPGTRSGWEMEAGDRPGRKKAGAGERGDGGSQGFGAAVQSDTKSVRHEVTQSGGRDPGHNRVGDVRPLRRPRGPRPPRAHVLRRRKSKSRRPPASGDARPLQSPLVVGGARCRLAAWDYDSDIGAGE